MLNVGLSDANQQAVVLLNEKIKTKFGEVILAQPGGALHITLMDWVAPLVNYIDDWDELFAKIFTTNDKVLSRQLENLHSFDIIFDTIRVSPAAIFIQGHDNGQFRRVRDDFVEEVGLPPGTKQPPRIVHCTIARFDKAVDLGPIKEYVETLNTNFIQRVEAFRLVREVEMPMLSYEVIKNYTLLSLEDE